MRKFFQLNEFCECNVWLAELPEIEFEAEKITAHQYSSNSLLNSTSFKVAVEIDIYVGGKSVYGMLGAEFIPNDSNLLTFEISTSENCTFIYDNSIILKPDEAYLGLPFEFLDFVLLGFDCVFNSKIQIPSGVFYVKWAAHGKIYSSPLIFQKLAKFIGKTWGSEDMLFNENLIKETLLT